VPAHRSLRGGADGDSGDAEQEGPRQVGQRWWYARGSWLLSASVFNRDAVALEDVTAFLLGPDHRIVERIDARRARSLEGSRWELEDAEVRSFRPDGVTLVRVPSRVIDIGLQRAELASLREPPLMSLRTLWRATFSGRMQGSDAQTVAMELHQRLARPLAILLLVLLAIPFALGGPERGDSFSRALLQCMAVAAGFWALWAVAVVSARAGWAPPGLPLWSIVALFFGAAALRFRAIDS
jgi:lipopolysaccharide export system permease protein